MVGQPFLIKASYLLSFEMNLQASNGFRHLFTIKICKKSLARAQKIALMLFCMPKRSLIIGLIAFTSLLGNRLVIAGDEVISTQTAPVPEQQGTVMTGDSSEKTKFYTISASLREGYDDNIFTAKSHKVDSFTTDFSPTILLDFPMDSSDFSLRYTFDVTYFENRPGDQFDLNHEFVARYNHAFSERYNLDVREQFHYYTEPGLMDSTGTLFRNGAYIDNLSSVEFTAKWTPLVGSVTTYTNNVVAYQDSAIAIEQNNMQNTVNQDINFAILPTYSLVFGGIFDNVSYESISRGYTNYTGNVGVDWQTTPSLVIGFRGGGTITDGQNVGTSSSPYASLTANWRLGQRSSLDFNYVHNVVNTDVIAAVGQEADRVTSKFKYDITPSISAHLEGIFTHSDYTAKLILPGTVPSFTEDVLAVDAGLDYHFNKNFDFDMGYTFTNVSSQLAFREYTRDQVYLGVRGTY